MTNNKEDKERTITIDDNKIKHQDKIKILGTIINSNLKWDSHINEGNTSLMAQLKQRVNSLKLISKAVSQKFARNLANSLIISKLNYNIEIWGDTSKYNINKINNILYKAAKIVLGSKAIGRTNSWMLKEMKWLDMQSGYENAMQNSIYKMINNKDDHFFKSQLIENRTIRIKKQNKVRHHSVEMNNNMQRSYLYRALNIFNKLPRNITLIKIPHLFKKWVKKFNLDNSIKLKEQNDNEDDYIQEDEEEHEEQCYNEEDDIDD